MEEASPGFSYQLLEGVLRKAGVRGQVEIAESMLRMEGYNNSDGEWLGGWVFGWVGGWVGGWLGGWVVGWVFGWEDG